LGFIIPFIISALLSDTKNDGGGYYWYCFFFMALSAFNALITFVIFFKDLRGSKVLIYVTLCLRELISTHGHVKSLISMFSLLEEKWPEKNWSLMMKSLIIYPNAMTSV
jgi:hypothetical protein